MRAGGDGAGGQATAEKGGLEVKDHPRWSTAKIGMEIMEEIVDETIQLIFGGRGCSLAVEVRAARSIRGAGRLGKSAEGAKGLGLGFPP